MTCVDWFCLELNGHKNKTNKIMYNSKWREKSVVLKHLFHHSTYIIQYHPVLKGTTQDIWHISIRRTHSFINGLVFTHSQKTTGEPLTPPAAAARSSSSWSAGNGRTYLCSWPSRSPAYAAPCGKHSTTQNMHFPRTDPPFHAGTNPSVPPVILREVDQDVHLIFLHESVGCAHVVVFQNRAIVVQDGHFWSVQDQRKKSPKISYILSLTL